MPAEICRDHPQNMVQALVGTPPALFSPLRWPKKSCLLESSFLLHTQFTLHQKMNHTHFNTDNTSYFGYDSNFLLPAGQAVHNVSKGVLVPLTTA
jgi:hypothetical protein